MNHMLSQPIRKQNSTLCLACIPSSLPALTMHAFSLLLPSYYFVTLSGFQVRTVHYIRHSQTFCLIDTDAHYVLDS